MQRLAVGLVVLWHVVPAWAQVGAAEPLTIIPAITDLDPVLVRGMQPGPGMWRVSKDDHTLWIMGTVAPLPKAMTWESGEVDDILAEAEEVLAPGSAAADIGAGEVFKMMTLAPSAVKSVNNPDGATLKDVLPPDIHARWVALKQQYIGNDRKIERSRPMFASQDLYWKAIDAAGLTRSNVVWQKVVASAKTNGVKVTPTGITYPLALDKTRYKGGIRALSESRIDDIGCFTQTMDRLQPDLAAMKVRGNAWATGDLEVLRQTRQEDLQPPCKGIYDAAMSFQVRPELAEKLAAAWLSAAENALLRNKTTFATLPVAEIFKPDGYIARLRAKGYTIRGPDEDAGVQQESPNSAAAVGQGSTSINVRRRSSTNTHLESR